MKGNCCQCDPRPAAVALARWTLGVIFLFAGIGKFMMGVPKFAGYIVDQFKNTPLPGPFVNVFACTLPFLEVILGVLLLLGLARNAVLFTIGVLLISLTFGQVLLQQPQTMFMNFVYTMITAAVLYAEHWDRWVVPCCNRAPAEKPLQPSDIT